jgi:hypothetical protein
MTAGVMLDSARCPSLLPSTKSGTQLRSLDGILDAGTPVINGEVQDP